MSIAHLGVIAPKCIGSNAFGNALGDALARSNSSGGAYTGAGSSNSLDAFLALNNNFSGASVGMPASQSVALQDGSLISADENLRRVQMSYSQQAMASNDILSPSAHVVMSDAGSGGLSDADIASMRAENLNRMKESAAQSATANYDSDGRMTSYQDASGLWHVVVSGVGQISLKPSMLVTLRAVPTLKVQT